MLDQFAKAMESAMGLAQSAGEEARAAVRAQADRVAAELDLVRRDELDALKAVLTAEMATLRLQVASLQSSAAKVRPTDDVG